VQACRFVNPKSYSLPDTRRGETTSLSGLGNKGQSRHESAVIPISSHPCRSFTSNAFPSISAISPGHVPFCDSASHHSLTEHQAATLDAVSGLIEILL
jgi:hypothetical protein